MSPELEKTLCESFPTLFKDRNGNPRDTAMCWGVETNSGWYNLLYEMCQKITEIDKEVYFVQVKEKFGGLRAYTSGISSENYDKVTKIIDEYERKSETICETCGKSGKIRNDLGWILTLCDDHYQETLDKRSKK